MGDLVGSGHTVDKDKKPPMREKARGSSGDCAVGDQPDRSRISGYGGCAGESEAVRNQTSEHDRIAGFERDRGIEDT